MVSGNGSYNKVTISLPSGQEDRGKEMLPPQTCSGKRTTRTLELRNNTGRTLTFMLHC